MGRKYYLLLGFVITWITCSVWPILFSGAVLTGGSRLARDVTLDTCLLRLVLGSCKREQSYKHTLSEQLRPWGRLMHHSLLQQSSNLGHVYFQVLFLKHHVHYVSKHSTSAWTRTTSQVLWHEPVVSKTKAFSFYALSCWNSFPEDPRTTESVDVFKRKLKIHKRKLQPGIWSEHLIC